MIGSKGPGRQITLSCDGSPATGDHTWGPPRIVILEREPGKSLGISIVGKFQQVYRLFSIINI